MTQFNLINLNRTNWTITWNVLFMYTLQTTWYILNTKRWVLTLKKRVLTKNVGLFAIKKIQNKYSCLWQLQADNFEWRHFYWRVFQNLYRADEYHNVNVGFERLKRILFQLNAVTSDNRFSSGYTLLPEILNTDVFSRHVAMNW